MSWKDLFWASKISHKFITILEEEASLAAKMSEIFARHCASTESTAQSQWVLESNQVEELGNHDRITILGLLNQSFITPFDREDINDLSQIMEDMINYGDITIRELELYHISMNAQIGAMAQQLQLGTAELLEAVKVLLGSPLSAQAHALKAITIQNQMADLYRHAIVSLDDESDIHTLMKMREVYRHIQNTAERLAAAGSLILRITVKQYG